VFFDNLQVTAYKRAAIGKETHYYPFGLTMAGISSKALEFGNPENKYKYNGVELSNKNFTDGSGLELYETKYRSYDPQIGRFHQTDPFSDLNSNWSPYVFGQNNPILFSDPLGLDTVRGKLPKDYNPAPGDVWINGKGQESIYNAEDGWVQSKTLGAVTVKSVGATELFAGFLYFLSVTDTYYGLWESGYDHENYTTTKGKVRPLPIGKRISEQAKMFKRRSNRIKGTGFGISFLTNLLTALEVRDQYMNGGISNVNPMDATGLVLGTSGLTANIVSRFGFAPQSMTVISNVAAKGSFALAGVQNMHMALDYIYNNPGINNWRPTTGNTQNDIILNNQYDNGFYKWTDYFNQ
jgi:RHS repeat-associated protein